MPAHLEPSSRNNLPVVANGKEMYTLTTLQEDTNQYVGSLAMNVHRVAVPYIEAHEDYELEKWGAGTMRIYRVAGADDIWPHTSPDMQIRSISVECRTGWTVRHPLQLVVKDSTTIISSIAEKINGDKLPRDSRIDSFGRASSYWINTDGTNKSTYDNAGEGMYSSTLVQRTDYTNVAFARLMSGLLVARLVSGLPPRPEEYTDDGYEAILPVGGIKRLDHLLHAWSILGDQRAIPVYLNRLLKYGNITHREPQEPTAY